MGVNRILQLVAVVAEEIPVGPVIPAAVVEDSRLAHGVGSASPSVDVRRAPSAESERKASRCAGRDLPIKGRKYMLQFVTEALIALRERQEGQAMVEYALILGLISVVAIGALTLIGADVNGILTAVEAALGAVPGA